MDSSVSGKDEIWFLRVCHHVPHELYIPNKLLHTDLQMPTVREEITKFSTNHTAKLLTHANELTSNLLNEQGPGRLKLFKPLDLPTRFP